MEDLLKVNHILDNLHDDVMKAIKDDTTDSSSLTYGPFTKQENALIAGKVESMLSDIKDSDFSISASVEKKTAGVDGVPTDEKTYWLKVKWKF